MSPLLVPVAHMLLHAREDAASAVDGLTTDEIWARPAGGASVGFHLRHLAGALDRLFTYARGEGLSPAQLELLSRESEPGVPPADTATLGAIVDAAVEAALAQLRATDEARLLDARAVGRKQLPTTVLGLLVHGGEHSARHAGQAITLKRLVLSGEWRVLSAEWRGESKR
jgi:DinB superfamily